jgi:hypothetical protein
MKIILICVAIAVGGYFAAGRYLSNPSTWRSARSSGFSPSPSGGKDLRVNTSAGKMYPGMPKFETVTINGKRYLQITTVKSSK